MIVGGQAVGAGMTTDVRGVDTERSTYAVFADCIFVIARI